MALTPDDVERQEFNTAWRGYDRQEVDRFLDLVSASLTQLQGERERFANRMEEVEREAGDSLGAERLLKRALIDAQRTADQTVAEARRAGEEILTDARREAESLQDRARAQAAGVRQAVEDLQRFRSEYGGRVRAVVERIGELPALPESLREVVERAESAAPPPADHPSGAPATPPGPADTDAATDTPDDDPEWDGPVPPWA